MLSEFSICLLEIGLYRLLTVQSLPLSKIVSINKSGQCEMLKNKSSATNKNKKQEMGQYPQDIGNLLDVKGYRMTELEIVVAGDGKRLQGRPVMNFIVY